MRNLKKASVGLLLCSVLTAGCTIDETIEKEVAKVEEKKSQAPEEIEEEKNPSAILDGDVSHDDYEMNERQEEMLEEADSKTAEEAVEHNILEKKVVVTNNVPQAKDIFTDKTEASQYFSYLLFQYHSSIIDGTTFYQKISPYISPKFEELLPKSIKERESMYESLQELFKEQLNSKITNYEMTEVTYDEMGNEGYFYRKYTLENGKDVFYKTRITKADNKAWLLIDDEPTNGYETMNSNVSQFKQTFVKTEEGE
ncbi:hypothetical protein LG296_19655 (plasmid) [Ureibacillus chungkukjangi]|uniref:hypothetical protein n=1 Tax=Ureibacillus chungkukjangi TaxID=1202712 RepID=UPI000D33F8B9|nr:hypothetical protein [Ureibacillus chungkukjangi]MCM3390571.1 hypothetical protein [Ureibacillus chungkukjangi]